MLQLLRGKHVFCDRLTRRNFLQVGGLAGAAASLPDLLRAEANGRRRHRHKSVITVFLPGGPSHVDTFDLKPEAPAEVRGEFRPISTNVPGIDICEHCPRIAQSMDKLALIRSIVAPVDDHACHPCLTGYSRLGPSPAGGRPSVGPVVSRLLGPVDDAVPPAIDLSRPMIHPPYNDPGPGYLGVGHAAFRPDGPSRDNMTLNRVTLGRMQTRQELFGGLDRIRREIDSAGALAGVDAFTQQAFDVLASPKMREAFDLTGEDQHVVDLYGPETAELVPEFNAAPRMTHDLLTARRLIEAGARCVTVSFGAWDWHYTNFPGHREQLPYLDTAVSGLVTDLHNRGLDQDVLVVIWGEFGRSPRINPAAGRDHWPAASFALLAGGGVRGGQVIGETDRLGERPLSRPVKSQDVLATIYRHLDIDYRSNTIPDLAGRPQYLLCEGQPDYDLFA